MSRSCQARLQEIIMGLAQSNFEFNCQEDAVENFLETFVPCSNNTCDGLATCFTDAEWEDSLINDAIKASNCGNELFVTEKQLISEQGLCMCEPEYGYVGKDCQEFTFATYFILSFDLILLLISVLGSIQMTKLVVDMYKRGEKLSKYLKTLTILLTLSCLFLTVLSTLIIIVIFTPQLATIDDNEGEKESFIEIYLYSTASVLALICGDLAVYVLVFSWATVISGMSSFAAGKPKSCSIMQKLIIALLIISILFTLAFISQAEEYFLFGLAFFNVGLIVIIIYCFISLGKKVKLMTADMSSNDKIGSVWLLSPLIYKKFESPYTVTAILVSRRAVYARMHQHMRNVVVYLLLGLVLGICLYVPLGVMFAVKSYYQYAEPGRLQPVVVLYQSAVFTVWLKVFGTIRFVILTNSKSATDQTTPFKSSTTVDMTKTRPISDADL